eukprot:954927-Rhodomonas_salina.2
MPSTVRTGTYGAISESYAMSGTDSAYQDTVVYSMSEIGEDHAGLPDGAMLAAYAADMPCPILTWVCCCQGPYGEGYVTELVVAFSAAGAYLASLYAGSCSMFDTIWRPC